MKRIEIFEVGPRDGFQNVNEYITVDDKISIINRLVEAGVTNIQYTSFVSPKAIPQMRDAAELTEKCLDLFPNINLMALVPNLRGAETANSLGISNISYVASLSEAHNRANINRTHEESYNALYEIVNKYPNMNICVDIATTFGCPFEGKVNNRNIVEFMRRYVDLGIKEFNLCDTIGVATPADVRKTIKDVKSAFDDLILQIHIHDTRNMGMVNTLAAIEEGISRVQSTLGGLGGCPFAPGASGNLATEDLVFMLNNMNYQTNINFDKLLEAAKYQKEIITTGNFSGHQQFI